MTPPHDQPRGCVQPAIRVAVTGAALLVQGLSAIGERLRTEARCVRAWWRWRRHAR